MISKLSAAASVFHTLRDQALSVMAAGALVTMKSATKSALLRTGVYHLRLQLSRLKRPGHRLIILVYHNLSSPGQNEPSSGHHFSIRPQLSVDDFSRHMQILKDSFPVISLGEGLSRLRDDSLQHDSVAITFDDAYRSFLTLAFPVLDRLQLPATVFVPTDFIESDRIFWWDELNQVFFGLLHSNVSATDLDGPLGPLFAKRFTDAMADLRRVEVILEDLEGRLRYEPSDRQSELIGALKDRLSPERKAKLTPEPMLTWEQMRSLAEHRIDFQSHTCSHFGFGNVTPAQIERELIESREIISSRVGRPVSMFAYPYGGDRSSYEAARELLHRCGYVAARTTNLGFNDSRSDPFLLNSAGIGSYSAADVIRRDLLLGFLRE